MTPEFLTIDDAATLLRCSTKSIRRHVHAGRLPALRGPGGRLLFESQSLRQALCPAVGGTAARTAVSQPATVAALAAMASDLTTINA